MSSIQSYRPPLVKQYYSPLLKTWIPWSLHPSQIATHENHEASENIGEVNAVNTDSDIRPHIYDPVMDQFLLCDSGSQVSAFPPDPGDQPVSNHFLKAANGTRMSCYGYKDVSIKIGDKPYDFKIIKAQVESPIIGWDFMDHHKLDLRWNENDQITIFDKKDATSSVLHLKPLPKDQSSALKNLSLVETEPGQSFVENPEILISEIAAVEALGEDIIEVHDEDIDILPESQYKHLLAKFPGLLKQNFHQEPTKSNIIHRIHTTGPPINAKARRLLPGSDKAIKAKKAWDELISLGIVEKVDPAKSNTYCSPLHFAPKSDGSLRPVGDYRLLNLQTELDQFPLPHLRDFTHHISGCTVFSKVDLRKAFHSIIIDERDRHKTCVATPWGLFNFKRLVMGMRNSAQSFQRMVQDVIGSMDNVFCYLDDLLIYTKSVKHHMQVLEELFSKLEAAGLTLALSKCQFGADSLEYLGYKVSPDGLSPLKKKVEALRNFPPPTKQKELLAFLGALNYYRASLPRLRPEDSVDKTMPERSPASVLDPLYKLATCNIKKQRGNYFADIWNCHPHLKDSFEDAKTLLVKAITLEFPMPSAPLALSTDASKTCLGASLDQWVNGQWRCLGLWSKTLKPAQQRYSTYIRELLAIKYAIRHFINEINGRTLICFTDHKPILGSWNNPNLQIHDNVAMNAINEIAQWTCDIRHKPGKDLLVPDLMSRPFKPSGSAYQVQPDSEDALEYSFPNQPRVTTQDQALVQSRGDLNQAKSRGDLCQARSRGDLNQARSRGDPCQAGSQGDLDQARSRGDNLSGQSPAYQSPDATIAALEEVCLNVVSPQSIADAQKSCPEVDNHRKGLMPKSIKMQDIEISGVNLYCEISDPTNPRPLLPEQHRSLVLNLLHHQDHPSARETLRRVSAEYYWPCVRKNVEAFVRTCHPCQVAKQSPTVKAGVGHFPVPDQRFSAIHLDVVGPLPASEDHKYLLTVFCRTSRWLEAYPMRQATSEECSKAFLQWASRYGVPHLAVSDNGNSFISNLYKDIMKTFNVEVHFTPAYHAATNGAIEKRHQTIKNSLKASLVDMGNEHGEKWMSALPWVLLGKRIAVQPDLDTSAAQLVFGKTLSVPGGLLGHPGAPLTNIQTKTLLEQLYKMSARPPIPTSTVVDPIDLSATLNARHVYVKVDQPSGLQARFEGPYPIVSRPSRSTVSVRIGSYVNGSPRLQTYNWNLCKIAHLRENALEGSRPQLGRKPKTSSSSSDSSNSSSTQSSAPESSSTTSKQTSKKSLSETMSTNPHPDYLKRGPLITREMFNKWTPELLGIRPPRSTRNPNPNYKT